MNDDTIVKSCLAGDQQAWSLLVERYAPLVRWAIRQKISQGFAYGGEYEVDDIFQHTFTYIWRNNRLKNLRNIDALPAWLVVVAQSRAISFMRKKREIPLPEETIAEEMSSSGNPRKEAQDSQLHKLVEELVEDLPLKERRIITLELFYDLKHREIADIMSVPVNTVSTIVSRVKQGLREKLTKRGYDV